MMIAREIAHELKAAFLYLHAMNDKSMNQFLPDGLSDYVILRLRSRAQAARWT